MPVKRPGTGLFSVRAVKLENGNLQVLDTGQLEGLSPGQVKWHIASGQLKELETMPSKIRKERLKEPNKRLEALQSTKGTGSGHR